mgnify:CR=1 FL=1
MAGKFPLAFSDVATYGSVTNNANPYYYIHNSSNLSVFANADTEFDVYQFSTDTTDDDAPVQAYSVLIIKNMGAADSELVIDDVEITFNNGAIANPFSLVTQLSDFHANAFNSDVLSPSQFDDLDGPSSETNNKLNTGINPIAYIALNQTSGDVVSGSFDDTNVKYIPVYNPKNENGDPHGLRAHGVVGNAVSATEISGVTYPEYAAFVVKCAPIGEMDITNNSKLCVSFTNSEIQDICFDLHVTSYRRGALDYEQGFWNTDTGTFSTNNIGSIVTAKTSSVNTQSVPWVVVAAGEEADQDPNVPSVSTNFSRLMKHDNDETVDNHVSGLQMPYGYKASQKGHTVASGETPDSDIDYKDMYVRVFDKTPQTGGVRLITTGTAVPDKLVKLSVTTTNQANTDNFVYDTVPLDDYALYWLRTPADDINADITLADDGVSGERYYKLSAGQSIYARIRYTGTDYDNVTYRNQYLHPQVTTHFNAAGTAKNRRVYAMGLPMFYNPFWISDASAAENGGNGETTEQDTLYFVVGDYYAWSTNVNTLSKYTNYIADATELAELNGSHANAFDLDRFTDSHITKSIHGITSSGYSAMTVKKNAANMTGAPLNITASSASDGKVSITKHKHIFDYFTFGLTQGGNTDTLSDINLQFNNISGLNHFFVGNFDWNGNVNTDHQPYNSDAESTNFTKKGVEISVTEGVAGGGGTFTPAGITDTSSENAQTTDSTIENIFQRDTATIPWSTYSGNQYPANAKYKQILLQLTYTSPNMAYEDCQALYTGGNPVPTAGSEKACDHIGRSEDSATVKISQACIDLASKFGSFSKKFVGGNFFETLDFKFTAKTRNRKWKGLRITGDTGITNAPSTPTLYVTTYPADNTFGTHSLSADDRATWTNDILTSSCQPQTSNTSLTNSGFGVLHEYASATAGDNYYYAKYPINGPASFKYEKYFKNGFIETLNTTAKTGTLPGPLAEGVFSGTTPTRMKDMDITANDNKGVLIASTSVINASKARYEAFIGFNLKNENDFACQLVSIDLENKVGDAGAGTYGDPRYISGSSANGIYKTALHTEQNRYKWSAPHVGGGDSPQLAVTLVLTSATTATHAANANIIDNMKITVAPGDASGITIPAGARLSVYNGTTMKLVEDDGITPETFSEGSGTVDVLLDYPQPDYVIWDIVDKKEEGANALTSWAKAAVSTGEGVSSAHGNKPTRNYYNTDFLSIGAGAVEGTFNVTPNPIGTLSGKVDTVVDGFDTNTLYANYETNSSDKRPRIYFALDNNALTGTTNNELSTGIYMNRLRVRYIIHDKLEKYGTNQEFLTNSTTNGKTIASHIEHQHVYEDTYLVKVDFANLSAEAVISDLESNTNVNESTIDFGTLQTG